MNGTTLDLKLGMINNDGHKFRHGFEDTVSPLCLYNVEIKSNKHFLLYCHVYFSHRLELFNNFNKINSSFFKLSAKDQVNILLFGYLSSSPISLSQDIIKVVINFLIKSDQFDRL